MNTLQQAELAERIDHKQREFAREVDGALVAADLAPRTFRDAVKKEVLRIGEQNILSHSGTRLPSAEGLVRHVVSQLKLKQETDEETRRSKRLHHTPEQQLSEAVDG